MAIKLVTTPPLEERVKQDVIDVLEEALAEARSGSIKSVIVIVRSTDGGWGEKTSVAMDFPDAVGRLEIVKQSWINSYIQTRE